MGIWDKANSYKEACEHLIDIIIKRADLQPDDVILDVACGYGEVANYMRSKIANLDLTGIDIVDSHIAAATQRYGSNIKFECGNAVDMPFKELAFDKIISVESAQHFDTREKFLTECWRLLRNEGRLAISDIIFGSEILRSNSKTMQYRRRFQIPHANIWTIENYGDHLKRIGFEDISLIDVTIHVLPDFIAFMKAKARTPEYRRRAGRLAARSWSKIETPVSGLRYIIVSARKPRLML